MVCLIAVCQICGLAAVLCLQSLFGAVCCEQEKRLAVDGWKSLSAFNHCQQC